MPLERPTCTSLCFLTPTLTLLVVLFLLGGSSSPQLQESQIVQELSSVEGPTEKGTLGVQKIDPTREENEGRFTASLSSPSSSPAAELPDAGSSPTKQHDNNDGANRNGNKERVLSPFSLYYFPKSNVDDAWKARVLRLVERFVVASVTTNERISKRQAKWANAQQTSLHVTGLQTSSPLDASTPSTVTMDGKEDGGASTTPLLMSFVVCVRDWLFDYLVHRYAPSQEPYKRPIALRHRMGELRTWDALLTALTDRYGCSLHISRTCSEGLLLSSSSGLYHRSSSGDPSSLSMRSDASEAVLLVEDLSIRAALMTLPNRSSCQQWSRRTLAVSGEESKFVPSSRTMTLFYTPSTAQQSLGLVAQCAPASQWKTVRLSAETKGLVPVKGWYAVLWGKTKQQGTQVESAVQIVQRYIPVISSCMDRCSDRLASANLFPPPQSPLSPGGGDGAPSTSVRESKAFGPLLASALLFVGVKAPSVGAALPEALSCGTYVIARGRNFGYEFASHPLTRRLLGKQQRDIDRELDRHVRDVLSTFGFDFDRPFDQQPHPPNVTNAYRFLVRDAEASSRETETKQSDETRRERRREQRRRRHGTAFSFLPERYSAEGYATHVGRVLGLDVQSKQCIMNRTLSLSSTRVAAGGGGLLPQLLDQQRKHRWVFEGCSELPV